MELDSYSDAGVFIAIGLVNEVDLPRRSGTAAFEAVASILEFDDATHALVRPRHAAELVRLAAVMHDIFERIATDDLDGAVGVINDLLADHPANPHLAKEDGRWRLHHHPATVGVVSMVTSICAEAIARLIASGNAHRLGLCADPTCRRAYVDLSKNSSRRYCSITCQNRMKTAAFRARRPASTTPTTRPSPQNQRRRR